MQFNEYHTEYMYILSVTHYEQYNLKNRVNFDLARGIDSQENVNPCLLQMDKNSLETILFLSSTRLHLAFAKK